MAEKDSGKYHYEPYTQISKPSVNVSMVPGLSHPGPSAKRTNDVIEADTNTSNCCACGGSQTGPFWIGLLTNLGICALLFAYTLLGKI